MPALPCTYGTPLASRYGPRVLFCLVLHILASVPIPYIKCLRYFIRFFCVWLYIKAVLNCVGWQHGPSFTENSMFCFYMIIYCTASWWRSLPLSHKAHDEGSTHWRIVCVASGLRVSTVSFYFFSDIFSTLNMHHVV